VIGIAVERVAYTYPGGVRALDGIDLVVGAGETLAIIGQNGSGKSTLVRQLNGLLRPNEGRVLLDGSEVGKRHVAELARLVGLAFQDPDRQIFAGTVRAEVAFGPRNLGLRGAELDRQVAEALDSVGLAASAGGEPVRPGLLAQEAAGHRVRPGDANPGRRPRRADDRAGPAWRGARAGDRGGARRARDGPSSRSATTCASSPRRSTGSWSCARVASSWTGRPPTVFAEQTWDVLASTYLEPPLAARVGARLGAGSTPTEASLVDALASRPRPT
jgi:hypothetical protein